MSVIRCEDCNVPLVNLAARRCDMCERAALTTSALKYSPGPWHTYGEMGAYVADADNISVATSFNGPYQAANACLIAEAPALLALARYAAERGEGDAEMAREILSRLARRVA